MSHPQIEEVSDSDPEEMDPSEYLPSDAGPPIAPASSSTTAVLPHRSPPPGVAPGGSRAPTVAEQQAHMEKVRSQIKNWHSLYPVYFDAGRTRAEGRRVPRSRAVLNPLAYDIAEAVANLGIQHFLEAMKTHPKDWANPGRVRVHLRDDDGKMHAAVKNKRHLYIRVAEFLQQNPTTEASPLKFRVPALPNPKVVPPAIPRGWKMGTILPSHSPAVTGGGVSENMFKEMMAEMQEQGGPAALGQGGGGGGMPALPPWMSALGGGGSASSGGESKKDKKDKKKGKS